MNSRNLAVTALTLAALASGAALAQDKGASIKGEKERCYGVSLACRADGLWFEVHPENYMVAGGPLLAWPTAIRARHAISLHGVALSLAADAEPDPAHLTRLAGLVRRIEPALVSEHLAWSAWRGAYYPDLLPFPRAGEPLVRIADNVARAQDALGRRIAIENPAHCLRIDGHAWDEIDFLAELARRTGCGLLLDVNNVYVGARNLGYSAEAYIDAFPGCLVMEIHLAGHGLLALAAPSPRSSSSRGAPRWRDSSPSATPPIRCFATNTRVRYGSVRKGLEFGGRRRKLAGNLRAVIICSRNHLSGRLAMTGSCTGRATAAIATTVLPRAS